MRLAAILFGATMLALDAPSFAPLQPDVLTASGTVVNAVADYDGDGDLDLFVGFGGAANRLYRNERGVFVDVAGAAGIADSRATRAAAWGDVDGDGDADLLVGFAPGGGSVLRLYRTTVQHGSTRFDRATVQHGATRFGTAAAFTDVTTAVGLAVDTGAVRQLAFVDVEADGDLDLFVAFRDRANALFRNDGGRFVDIAASIGLADARRNVGALWFDADEDGDLDLLVSGMDGDANALYRNDRGRFVDVAAGAGLAWGGRAPKDAANGTVRPCAADVNGDGRLDLFFANYGPNGLFLNRGGLRFEDASAAWGVAIDGRYDTCAFGDFDNDGALDLYVNGTVTGGTSYPDYLYRNGYRNAREMFVDVTPANLRALSADHGALWADVDGDGDEDLALTGTGKEPLPLVLRNELASSTRALRIRVVDGHGRATLAGAEVRLYAAGTRRLLGTRLVDSGSGYNAQNDMPVQVALPGVSRVDVEVIYPANGRRLRVVRTNVNVATAPTSLLVVRVG
jgi:VCBS repeat protein